MRGFNRLAVTAVHCQFLYQLQAIVGMSCLLQLQLSCLQRDVRLRLRNVPLMNMPYAFPSAVRSYCILGDGCMMEGISNEACSLAGHWGLGKLIALYDDNNISIDGHTEISFTEDVAARFEALGWHVQHVKDGNTDFDALRKVRCSG
jgi:hypothetical protein